MSNLQALISIFEFAACGAIKQEKRHLLFCGLKRRSLQACRDKSIYCPVSLFTALWAATVCYRCVYFTTSFETKVIISQSLLDLFLVSVFQIKLTRLYCAHSSWIKATRRGDDVIWNRAIRGKVFYHAVSETFQLVVVTVCDWSVRKIHRLKSAYQFTKHTSYIQARKFSVPCLNITFRNFLFRVFRLWVRVINDVWK